MTPRSLQLVTCDRQLWSSLYLNSTGGSLEYEVKLMIKDLEMLKFSEEEADHSLRPSKSSWNREKSLAELILRRNLPSSAYRNGNREEGTAVMSLM